jgi:adenine-specific DNA-methyltransferase
MSSTGWRRGYGPSGRKADNRQAGMARSKDISVEALRHKDKRRNIPTAELEPVMDEKDKTPIRLAYERRNRDLDPQLVWRGKDEQDWSDLIVQAPPLYIQEKVHPKVLIDDLLRQSKARRKETTPAMPDLFADFNGLPDKEAVTEFYQHDANWSNRMILGDSLSVMASLAEREGLRGKVQCIYIDPPYGIRFNSNFQWSTTSRDVKDGNKDHITREPQQVRAFRDTWRDGIHSYLTYLRDRLTVARDLLADTGSIFVQIGQENCHFVRSLLDEIFGSDELVSQIVFAKTAGATSEYLAGTYDMLLWYAKNREKVKYRQPLTLKQIGGIGGSAYKRVRLPDLTDRSITDDELSGKTEPPPGSRVFRVDNLTSQSVGRDKGEGAASWFPVQFQGTAFRPTEKVRWKTNEEGMDRLLRAGRLSSTGKGLYYLRYFEDFLAFNEDNVWSDTGIAGFASEKRYVVETSDKVIQRCVLMTTDPGDLVLDPTCGSGTTAYVAEQWGRRWITIDTSRVALALARARIMGARYPYYLLADNPEGQRKEAEVSRTPPKETQTHNDIRQGFVYERVPHITLKSIANNAEIDVIWEKWQENLDPLRARLNAALGRSPPSLRGGAADEAISSRSPRRSAPRDDNAPWEEWEIPREAGDPWPENAARLWAFARGDNDRKEIQKAVAAINAALCRSYTHDTLPDAPRDPWPEEPTSLHTEWWQARIARQKEIDASIAAKADFEYLYDKPYTDNSRTRVAGPFTVESLSPHRVVPGDADDSLVHELAEAGAGWQDFGQMVLENLKTAGVQQAHKEDRITFTALTPWPGKFISAEGRYSDGSPLPGPPPLAGEGRVGGMREKRAAILVGPEFGIVSRPDLVNAAREAADAGFDVVIACAFNFDARSGELDRIGRIPILKARMNPDLHMAGELKNTGAGNLFVVFGEPDIEIEEVGADRIRVKIKGVDVFKPQTGEIESGGPDTIALWFIDTDYNEESFFVRHAYFLGAATDPYKALKTTLKAEIDEEAWASLQSDFSRPFPKPKSGRIAVKVINHLGDEVMKVFSVK